MTTYYVSPYGSDANDGLSALSTHSWLTIGKALGASGIASGDTVYICPGTYRETVTVAMTSAVGTTTVAGDPGNVQGFKDNNAVLVTGGDVVWTSFTVNDWVAGTGVNLTLSGRDFLSFSNIVFIQSTGKIVDGNTQTSTDCTFTDCVFSFDAVNSSTATDLILWNAAANVALNLTFNRCYLLGTGNPMIQLNVDTPATADFNLNVLIQNCIFLGGGNIGAVAITSGATTNTFKYGGVSLYNCTYWGTNNILRTVSAGHATSIPSVVYNCLVYAGGINAQTSGQIVEDNNLILASTPRSNVSIGTHSQVIGPTMIEFYQSLISGRAPRPLFSPVANANTLGFGAHSGGPSVDILNRNRASGVTLSASGTATSGAAKTITDTAKAFAVNGFKGWTIQLTGGTGSGQTKSIASNTATAITVDGNWKTNPDNTSTYQVYWGDPSSTGKATSGAATTLTDSGAAWGTNQWTGYTVEVDGGTGSGESAVITSNTATALTVPSWSIATPDNTSTYKLYKATGITTQDYAVGAFERQDVAQMETTTTDAGGVSIAITGQGTHDFRIPVNAASTVVTVRVQYDTAHGTGSKPTATILANGEIGVTTATQTAVGGAGSWETLTFGAIVPTGKGVITLRLASLAAASNGRAFFDTVTVT